MTLVTVLGSTSGDLFSPLLSRETMLIRRKNLSEKYSSRSLVLLSRTSRISLPRIKSSIYSSIIWHVTFHRSSLDPCGILTSTSRSIFLEQVSGSDPGPICRNTSDLFNEIVQTVLYTFSIYFHKELRRRLSSPPRWGKTVVSTETRKNTS